MTTTRNFGLIGTAITFFPSREAAEAVAVENNADDDWIYEVVEASRGFVVRIKDDGEIIGSL